MENFEDAFLLEKEVEGKSVEYWSAKGWVTDPHKAIRYSSYQYALNSKNANFMGKGVVVREHRFYL